MGKDVAISVRVEPAIKEALERLAEAEQRPVASYVRKLIVDHVEAQRKGRRK